MKTNINKLSLLCLMAESILCLCAHNDDQIIGAGGSLRKYANQGKIIKTIIFSFGQSSHPHLKTKVIVDKRVGESLKADKILGGSGIAYLNMREGHFKEDFKKKKMKMYLKKVMNELKPTKIFTHSDDDFHPYHKAIFELVSDMIKKKEIACAVYTFEIWNIIKLKKKRLPKLVEDISETFQTKVDALKAHKSQKATILSLMWNIYLKAITNGFFYGCKYADVFYKIN